MNRVIADPYRINSGYVGDELVSSHIRETFPPRSLSDAAGLVEDAGAMVKFSLLKRGTREITDTFQRAADIANAYAKSKAGLAESEYQKNLRIPGTYNYRDPVDPRDKIKASDALDEVYTDHIDMNNMYNWFTKYHKSGVLGVTQKGGGIKTWRDDPEFHSRMVQKKLARESDGDPNIFKRTISHADGAPVYTFTTKDLESGEQASDPSTDEGPAGSQTKTSGGPSSDPYGDPDPFSDVGGDPGSDKHSDKSSGFDKLLDVDLNKMLRGIYGTGYEDAVGGALRARGYHGDVAAANLQKAPVAMDAAKLFPGLDGSSENVSAAKIRPFAGGTVPVYVTEDTDRGYIADHGVVVGAKGRKDPVFVDLDTGRTDELTGHTVFHELSHASAPTPDFENYSQINDDITRMPNVARGPGTTYSGRYSYHWDMPSEFTAAATSLKRALAGLSSGPFGSSLFPSGGPLGRPFLLNSVEDFDTAMSKLFPDLMALPDVHGTGDTLKRAQPLAAEPIDTKLGTADVVREMQDRVVDSHRRNVVGGMSTMDVEKMVRSRCRELGIPRDATNLLVDYMSLRNVTRDAEHKAIDSTRLHNMSEGSEESLKIRKKRAFGSPEERRKKFEYMRRILSSGVLKQLADSGARKDETAAMAAAKGGDANGKRESTAPTDEQIAEALEFLRVFREREKPTNEWEAQALDRLLRLVESTYGKIIGPGDQEPRGATDGAEPAPV